MRLLSRSDSLRGFSLVEVLIAVLVLAIGLLGLGAVFPAIIAEQRGSFESIEGENAAGAAASLLTSGELVEFSLLSQDFDRPLRGGPVGVGIEPPHYSYEWIVPQNGQSYYNWSSPVPGFTFPQGLETGLWSFNLNNSRVNSTIQTVTNNPALGQLPIGARLYPQPYSGKDPKYVWDLAMRREPSGDRPQAAIFVRRIDARIRVPKGFSLSDVLTGNNGVRNGQVLPVAINPSTGQPDVDNGVEEYFYAAIQMLEVEVDKDRLNWLLIPNNQPLPQDQVDTSVSFATQVGQKLVDNTGVVRTVVGRPQLSQDDLNVVENASSSRIVIVDPPFTTQNAPQIGRNVDEARSNVSQSDLSDSDLDDERASWVRQVIFTPRTPVAVRVVTLEGGE